MKGNLAISRKITYVFTLEENCVWYATKLRKLKGEGIQLQIHAYF